jgi:hypothetical protein
MLLFKPHAVLQLKAPFNAVKSFLSEVACELGKLLDTRGSTVAYAQVITFRFEASADSCIEEMLLYFCYY